MGKYQTATKGKTITRPTKNPFGTDGGGDDAGTRGLLRVNPGKNAKKSSLVMERKGKKKWPRNPLRSLTAELGPRKH